MVTTYMANVWYGYTLVGFTHLFNQELTMTDETQTPAIPAEPTAETPAEDAPATDAATPAPEATA